MPLSVKDAHIRYIADPHGCPGAERTLVQFAGIVQHMFVQYNIRCQHSIGRSFLLHAFQRTVHKPCEPVHLPGVANLISTFRILHRRLHVTASFTEAVVQIMSRSLIPVGIAVNSDGGIRLGAGGVNPSQVNPCASKHRCVLNRFSVVNVLSPGFSQLTSNFTACQLCGSLARRIRDFAIGISWYYLAVKYITVKIAVLYDCIHS